MLKKILDFFLKRYRSSPLELQKKSEILLLINFMGIILLLTITIIEIIFKQPIFLILPFIGGVIFSILILILFRAGKYELSSVILIFGVFSMQTLAIIIDKYDNVFDIYRYSFVITTLIFVNGVISYTKKQLMLINFSGLMGIIFFYFYRHVYQLKNYGSKFIYGK